MKIGIIGFGKMGKIIAEKAIQKNFEILCVFDIANVGENIGKYIGKETSVVISDANKIKESIEKLGEKPDVMIDFSSAEGCVKNAKICAEEKINLVIGTTGLSDEQKREIFDVVNKENIGLVMSPNMSIGVNIYWKIIEYAGEILKNYGFDVEIVEEHHKQKKDAPSGTAKKIQEILKKIYNKEIPTHSIRAGTIPGTHLTIFAGNNEIIKIEHLAYSREIFANGALLAAEFIKGKKGIYDMNDVLNLNG